MYKCKNCGSSEDVMVGYYVDANDPDMDVYDDGFGCLAIYENLPAHCNHCGTSGLFGDLAEKTEQKKGVKNEEILQSG